MSVRAKRSEHCGSGNTMRAFRDMADGSTGLRSEQAALLNTLAQKGCSNANRKKHKGFTLIETLISIYLVMLAAGIFVALLPSAAATEKMVGYHEQAASLVQHKIDQLRGVGYGRLTYTELLNAGVIDTTPTTSPYTFNATDSLSTYLQHPTSTITVSDLTSDTKQVIVTITWTGSSYHQATGNLRAVAFISKD